MKYKTTTSFSGNTDLGKQRTNNEDAFVVQNIWDKNHVLAVAIDGVGGYEGGEVAAAIAQKTIVEYLEKYPNGERLDLLKQAVVSANNSIFEERQKQENLANMSCVLTAALIETDKKQINMVHVGDTRLYLYRLGEMRKLSHDHSLIGYREEVGDLSEEEAMRHPQRNIIGRDVGSAHHETGDRDFLEAATFPLLSNSTLLLCSDGLCDMVTSMQMMQILKQEISLEEKVKGLIDAALTEGGKDNITVVLIEYQSNEPEKKEENTTIAPTNISIEHVVETKEQIITQVEKKRSPVLKLILVAVVALLFGLVGGLFIPDKHNPVKTPVTIPQDTIKHETLHIQTVDSLLIINEIDTVLMKDTLSSNVNGIWIK